MIKGANLGKIIWDKIDYSLAVVFCLLGLILCIKHTPSGLLIFIPGILLFPKTREKIFQKTGCKITRLPVAIILLICVPLAFNILDKNENNSQIIKKQSSYLPELNASDIYLNLQKAGFSKSEMKQTSSGDVIWVCELKKPHIDYTVTIYGKSYDEIYLVVATSLIYKGDANKQSAEFLSYIATIPYSTNSPESAKNWVNQNIAKKESNKAFGAGKMRLFGHKRARTLQIST